MKHTISVLVENRFGVLSHVSGLFSARGFNIDSLAVGETEDPTISRMTIVVEGDDRTLEQVMKQLNKLIDVIRVYDLTKKEFVERELLLIKVNIASPKERDEVLNIAKTMEAKIANAGQPAGKAGGSVIVEVTGDQKKVKSLIELLRPFGIKEMAQTGRVALSADGGE